MIKSNIELNAISFACAFIAYEIARTNRNEIDEMINNDYDYRFIAEIAFDDSRDNISIELGAIFFDIELMNDDEFIKIENQFDAIMRDNDEMIINALANAYRNIQY
ncbi:MAG: hypothetical protein Q8S44_07295 [Flavobacteriaceae bacterium]|nr:hypothetical protein [Flavobacteriaceae bacterium]